MRNSYQFANDGSSWVKWDLHIHTPETKLANEYSTINNKDVWDIFIEKIDNSDVMVFGITDYFNIDNYEKFLDRYKSKKHKLEKIFFPNIEFRLDVSVNKRAEEVHIHVIFDNTIDIQEIKRFLDHLETNLEENGHKTSCSKLSDDQFVKAAISIDNLEECLKNIFGNRKCYIIGAAANGQGLRADTNSPRKMIISDYIEKRCDFIFGGSQNRDYFLRTNRYESGESSSKKPVVSGSDAHSLKDMDEKLGKGQFCTWIKSMPTFNGLRQMLFEPEDRVAIRSTEPDYKEPHNIIKSITISDGNQTFGEQKILINKNLNTIIGGKSAGKSLLLYFMARTIDIEQLRRLHDKFENFEGYSIENLDFIVEWADTSVDSTNIDDYWEDIKEDIRIAHKITYIPQLYINHLAEKNGKEELNNLIDEILLQNAEYRNYKSDVDLKISEVNERISVALNSMMKLRNELISISEERKKYSTSEIYETEIEKMNKKYTELNTDSTFSKEEADDYREIKANLSEQEAKIAQLNSDKLNIQQIKNEILRQRDYLLGNVNHNIIGYLNKFTNKHSHSSKIIEIINTGFSNILQKIDLEYSITADESEIKLLEKNKLETEKKLDKYSTKFTSKSELNKIIQKLESLKHDKKYAIDLQSRSAKNKNEYQTIKNNISNMVSERSQLYESIKTYINNSMNDMGSEINLTSKLLYELGHFKFYDFINRNYSNENINSLFNETDKILNYKHLSKFLLDLRKIDDVNLYFKDKTEQPLKGKRDAESVYRALVEDNFKITYDVTYKGDNLLKMSPGKKGTVLLILFLELSSSETPILIDQPEDNLDNRTIYDLLCKMIKSKKKERQIIIVTHNANLVVNTDAENVIIANQEGQDPSTELTTSRTKFEYINGPIELSFNDGSFAKILAKTGVKQHICDILEGGKEAFKLRELKYHDD